MNHGRRLTARVTGIVQGVGFREFAAREAQRLGLAGTVRNCADGAVEAIAEGPEPELRDLRLALSRGPWSANVQRVDAAWSEATGEFRGFRIVC
jgi:acylphosphatase